MYNPSGCQIKICSGRYCRTLLKKSRKKNRKMFQLRDLCKVLLEHCEKLWCTGTQLFLANTAVLEPVAAKACTMVLRERSSNWLEQQLLEPQYGFGPGRGCDDALFSLRSLCILAWNKNTRHCTSVCWTLQRILTQQTSTWHGASCLHGAHLPSL